MLVKLIFWTLLAAALVWYFGGFNWWHRRKKRQYLTQQLVEQPPSLLQERLLTMLQERRFNLLKAELEKLPDSHLLVFAKHIEVDLQPVLVEFNEQETGHYQGLLVQLQTALNQAWKERSGAVAEDLTPDQVSGFQQYITLALQTGEQLHALFPDKPQTYPLIVRCCIGMGKKERAYQFYADAEEAGAVTYDLANSMLTLLSSRWSGSYEERHAFARAQIDKYPHIPGMPGLILPLAMEEAMDSSQNSQVLKTLLDKAALKEALNYVQTLSPEKESEREPYYELLNLLALIYAERGQEKQAKQVFKLIGDEYRDYPWCYRAIKPQDAFILYASTVA